MPEEKVLVIEDNLINIELVRDLLENSGYSLLEADTADKGIKLAKAELPKLILMDIDLGRGISGIETTKRIRKMTGYEDLPIVAVTALAMQGQKEMFLEEGCSHYISKPFDAKTLQNMIKELL